MQGLRPANGTGCRRLPPAAAGVGEEARGVPFQAPVTTSSRSEDRRASGAALTTSLDARQLPGGRARQNAEGHRAEAQRCGACGNKRNTCSQRNTRTRAQFARPARGCTVAGGGRGTVELRSGPQSQRAGTSRETPSQEEEKKEKRVRRAIG